MCPAAQRTTPAPRADRGVRPYNGVKAPAA